MASIHSHQIQSKVNDLYIKLQKHAQIIMRLSVELDKTRTENEELKSIVSDNRRTLKKLCNAHNNSQHTDLASEDNNTSLNSNNLNETYEQYADGQLIDIESSKIETS